MKKALIYSAMVLLAGAMACNKTDLVLSGDGHIRFAPTGVETRALVTNDNIQAETFQVFDFIGTTKYIDETISYNTTTSTWDYASGVDYLWKAGTHKFFGFTQNAGTLSANVLTVSKTLTTAEADQADLLYSEVFSTSPLVIGIADGTYYIASDVNAIVGNTQRVIYLEDGDIVEVSSEGLKFPLIQNNDYAKRIEEITISAQETEKCGFDTYMEKEINEQPESIERAFAGRFDSFSKQF